MSDGDLVFDSIAQLILRHEMMKAKLDALTDRVTALEQPATVAAEPDDLHPVALKLAEAYRLAWTTEHAIDTIALRDIRMAWGAITEVDSSLSNDAILAYGLPK